MMGGSRGGIQTQAFRFQSLDTKPVLLNLFLNYYYYF